MGVNWLYDPDSAYELTTDNVKKILAIHMRFRWEVVIYCFDTQGLEQMQLSVCMATKLRKIEHKLY